MDSDQGKLFIGGISWDTTEEKLRDYFGQYGDVLLAAVMRDKNTGRPRGFGFVVFSDPDVLDRVLQDDHTIDGRVVEAKRALSREEQQNNTRTGYSNSGRSAGTGGNVRTKKIFVGGLPSTLTEDEFRQYFETYGLVTDVVIMYDQTTQRPRGFGFISFDTEEAVDRVLHKTFHDLNGKKVEVKRALPKDANPYGANRPTGAGSGGGSYSSYGGSGGSAGSYDSRADSSRYMQPLNAAGVFPSYGSSGYGAPGYGYGPANSGTGYGSYGAYGSANAGFGGPSGAAFGNANGPSSIYGGGPQGGSRTSWNSQAPMAYGGMAYGNSVPWVAPSGAPASAPSVQSPSGTTGYGNQGYDYTGYGGSDGANANRAGYAPGGGMQGNDVAYSGGGYANMNGNAAYGSAAWRSDPSQASGNYGAQAAGPLSGYNGGYSGSNTRQAQPM